MSEEIKSRGVKKGEKRPWKAGRKKGTGVGRIRNINISFRVSPEEKEYIYNVLNEEKIGRTEALIQIFEYYKKNKNIL